MLCAVGTAADPTLDDGAPRFLALLAALISDRMATPEAVRRRIALDESRAVQHLLTAGSMTTVYQPLVRLPDGKVVGYEALARFGVGAFRGPAQAFAAAARVGRGVEPRAAAARAAVAAVDVLPAGTTLTINLSAEALLDPCVNEPAAARGLRALARGARLGVEITEHTHVPDYAPLLRVRERLRTIGVPLCIDDAGAGFASFRHVLRLRPDVIKVDVDLVRDVDTDPVRRALIRSLVGFAEEVDAPAGRGRRDPRGARRARRASASAWPRGTCTAARPRSPRRSRPAPAGCRSRSPATPDRRSAEPPADLGREGHERLDVRLALGGLQHQHVRPGLRPAAEPAARRRPRRRRPPSGRRRRRRSAASWRRPARRPGRRWP
nr:EAL domain-containing protein [Angustibacter aerolatus]